MKKIACLGAAVLLAPAKVNTTEMGRLGLTEDEETPSSIS